MTDHPDDPKDDGGRVPGFTYAWMIPYLAKIGRRHGYAMAVHGSMSRDLDVVAVPWVETANTPKQLLEEILRLTGGTQTSPFSIGPHGRLSTTIGFDGAWHYIDLSFVPIPPKCRPDDL